MRVSHPDDGLPTTAHKPHTRQRLLLCSKLSQNQLTTLTGIPQSTLSALENGRIKLGVERARILARARCIVILQCWCFRAGM